MKTIQIPARVSADLIKQTKKKLRAEGLTWIALMNFVLKAYLEDKIKIALETNRAE